MTMAESEEPTEDPTERGSTLVPTEEPVSQAMLPVADRAVLFVCRDGADLDAVGTAMLALGLRPKMIPTIEQAPLATAAPDHCFVDWSVPGAPEYVAELGKPPHDLLPVAIVGSKTESASAFAKGAVATLCRPLSPDEVLGCLQGMRERRERRRNNDAIVEHDLRASAATAFEAVLRSLGQELRNPLATALANVEYLVEVAAEAVSPLSDEEQLAVTTDTLEAMQRLRSTLEGMSVLALKDNPVVEPVRLWNVAQRVIDELPSGTPLVELQGDRSIRGWGDESTLVEVTSVLVKRAITRRIDPQGPRITLHVYAHDTEARLTVREWQSSGSRRRTTDDPFAAGRSTRSGGQAGLELASARHAVVKLGGMLSYVSQKESGCAFRLRLRLAQPAL
jgi:signal transduction histidine kinase